MLEFDVRAQMGLLTWIYRGGVTIHQIDVTGLNRIIELTKKYQDQPIDLADATLVVAAEETATTGNPVNRQRFSRVPDKRKTRYRECLHTIEGSSSLGDPVEPTLS